MEEPRWTLDELAERVDAALAVDYHGQSSGRVRDIPDRRAIRWYTTIGLIDRPVAQRGRTALYGPRHLLQLVAVKRLQARGLPLVAVQQELAGATDTDLARVARLPATAATAAPAAAASVPVGPRAPAAARRLAAAPVRRAAFWREAPVAALSGEVTGAADAAGGAEPAEGAGTAGTAAGAMGAAATTEPTEPAGSVGPVGPVASRDGSVPAPTARVATLQGVRLGDGATLLLEPGRDLDAADLRAILDAARPLLAVLHARQLGGAPAPERAVDGDPRREHQ